MHIHVRRKKKVMVSISFYGSLAGIQPNIPSSQPGTVVLVFIGHKVFDERRDSWFERIRIQVGPIPEKHSIITHYSLIKVDRWCYFALLLLLAGFSLLKIRCAASLTTWHRPGSCNNLQMSLLLRGSVDGDEEEEYRCSVKKGVM